MNLKFKNSKGKIVMEMEDDKIIREDLPRKEEETDGKKQTSKDCKLNKKGDCED